MLLFKFEDPHVVLNNRPPFIKQENTNTVFLMKFKKAFAPVYSASQNLSGSPSPTTR